MILVETVSFSREDFCVQPPCGQLNPMVDEMYGVLEQVFEEYFEIFQFDSFHYGGDEVCFNQNTRRKSFFIFIQNLTLSHSLRSLKIVALHAANFRFQYHEMFLRNFRNQIYYLVHAINSPIHQSTIFLSKYLFIHCFFWIEIIQPFLNLKGASKCISQHH